MNVDPTTQIGRGEWATYRRLLGYVFPYWKRLVCGLLCGVLYGVATAAVMFSLKGGLGHLIDGEVTGLPSILLNPLQDMMSVVQDAERVALVLIVCLLGFTVLRGVAFYLSKYYVEWVGHRVVMNIRNTLFSHIQDLPLASIQGNRTGELMSRTASDTQLVERGVSQVIGDLIRQPFALVGLIVVLFHTNARLALISLVLFPIWLIPVTVFGRKVRLYARQGQAHLGDLASVQQEAIFGNRIVKAFGGEAMEAERFARHAYSVFRRQVRITISRAAVTPIIEFISILTACLLIVYALRAGIGFNDLFVFVGVLVAMYEPVKRLSRLHIGVQQTSAAADRIFEILDMPTMVKERSGAIDLTDPVELITFESTSFSYGEKPVLRGITLSVEAGECVALVGGSGAGKTTLVSLLPRFFDVTEGSILINGRDHREYTLASLRRQFGIVTQETVLFNRSVEENIAYGMLEISREAVEEVARRAHAHDFIMEMDKGYDTIIGERGNRLSGGQRQRVAIARALLRNPPVLILDEATSSLDTESERYVQAALDELMKGRTVFAIAHRLSTIRHADRIFVLKEGRVIEEGTHAELLATEGAYRHFYDLQSS